MRVDYADILTSMFLLYRPYQY